MNAQKKQAVFALLAFFLLLAVSVYRQLSIHFFPNDIGRSYIIYAGYLVLLLGWVKSICCRVTQKNMRILLTAEAFIMIFWMTIRFIQDTFLMNLLYPLRLTGYLIHVPAIFIPLVGFFASCCIGKGDDYRISRRWNLLWIPALLLFFMVLTDPIHHFVYSVHADDPQPNIYFHPHLGLYLIFAWILGLAAARVCMIFRRNRALKNRRLFDRLVPFLEIVLIVAFCAPYAVQSFYVDFEIVELSAGLFFIEAIAWEVYIYAGLIPVNTQHELVFHHSTVGMQILSTTGSVISRAENSLPISGQLFDTLLREGMVLTPGGVELWMQPISSGYMVWQKNVASLHRIIDELHRTGDELQQESALLSQELRAKSEKAAVQEKNEIYIRLSQEVDQQLKSLAGLLQQARSASADPGIFRRICMIGTYIKQRCNLRLIEQAEGVIVWEDLNHSFRDLCCNLRDGGIDASVRWACTELSSAAFALKAFDLYWSVIEQTGFCVRQITGDFTGPGSFQIVLSYEPEEVPRVLNCGSEISTIHTDCSSADGEYRIHLWEGVA